MRLHYRPVFSENLLTIGRYILIEPAFGKQSPTEQLMTQDYLLALLKCSDLSQVFIDVKHIELLQRLDPESRRKIVWVVRRAEEVSAINDREVDQLAVVLSPNYGARKLPAQTRWAWLSFNDMEYFSADMDTLKRHFKLVITDVDSHQTHAEVRQKELKTIMGDFFITSDDEAQTTTSTNKTAVVRLISCLNDPDLDFDQVTDLIVSDNILSYKLLKLINCPIFRGRYEITSIRDAVVRFGLRNLKNWGTSLGLSSYSYKPMALFEFTLERATFCLKLAQAKQLDDPDSFYTVGLLSTLDAFLDSDMATILSEVAIKDTLRDAIVNQQGLQGDVLRLVAQYQRGHKNGFSTDIVTTYLDSFKTTQEILASLN